MKVLFFVRLCLRNSLKGKIGSLLQRRAGCDRVFNFVSKTLRGIRRLSAVKETIIIIIACQFILFLRMQVGHLSRLPSTRTLQTFSKKNLSILQAKISLQLVQKTSQDLQNCKTDDDLIFTEPFLRGCFAPPPPPPPQKKKEKRKKKKERNFNNLTHYMWYLIFFLSNCIVVPLGLLSLEIRVPFLGERQLWQSCATQPTACTGCFSVSIIHRTLRGTAGSLMWSPMLMQSIALARGGVETP